MKNCNWKTNMQNAKSLLAVGFAAACFLASLTPEPALAQIPIRIVDRLGEGQVSEEAAITVADETKTIRIDLKHPIKYVDFELPSPGAYRVEVKAKTKLVGEQQVSKGRGASTCLFTGGEVLALGADYSQSPFPVTMVMIGMLPTARPRSTVIPVQPTVPGTMPSGQTRSMPYGSGQGYAGPSVGIERTCFLCNGSGNHGKKYVPSYGVGDGAYVDDVCRLCGGLGKVKGR